MIKKWIRKLILIFLCFKAVIKKYKPIKITMYTKYLKGEKKLRNKDKNIKKNKPYKISKLKI